MELLIDGGRRRVDVDALPDDVATVRDLLPCIRTQYVRQTPEMFMSGDSVYVLVIEIGLPNEIRSKCDLCRRPGILVLINDADWELEDGLDYALRDGDRLVFISTLHGG